MLRCSSNNPLISEPAQYTGLQNYFGVILETENSRRTSRTPDILVELFISFHSFRGQPGPRLSPWMASRCGSPPCFLWTLFGSCE